MKKVAFIMGSTSDFEALKKGILMLKQFSVEYEVHAFSAHRMPDKVRDFAVNAEAGGFGVIIAAAGKAAHLAGAVAANTMLPVIGLPVRSSELDGLDALLSTVQMPSGVPVATVAINGAENAAFLACQILALSDDMLSDRLKSYRRAIKGRLEQADIALQAQIAKEIGK